MVAPGNISGIKILPGFFSALEIILTLHIRNDRILLTQDMVLRRLNNKRFIQNVDDIKSIKFDKGQKNILSSENMGKDE